MARPKLKRHICCDPEAYYFKPRGIPTFELEEIALEIDEYESIRLADIMRLSQEEAARRMKISRPTFGRILAKARGKLADAIVNGKAIKITKS